jgi:predicted dehydrogenase
MASDTGSVRVAVVGVGGMGGNHARVLASLKGVELVGLVDADRDKADALAARFGCRGFGDISELPDIDAATVAVPSSLHTEIGCGLLSRGIHCLIEKPLATSEAEAIALIDAAERSGARLLVGHIERFNPAVRQLKEILADGHDIQAVEARRMSAVSARITDVDVVTDLMVHDLDIVLDLVGEPVTDCVARAVSVDGSAGGDYVSALISFAGGAVGSLTASRITQNRVRELQVTTDSRYFTVDYANQELLIFSQGRVGALGDELTDTSRYVLDVGTERVFVRRVEPLMAELQHFVDVARGRAEPLVGGAAALDALRLVWRIQEQAGGARRG